MVAVKKKEHPEQNHQRYQIQQVPCHFVGYFLIDPADDIGCKRAENKNAYSQAQVKFYVHRLKNTNNVYHRGKDIDTNQQTDT